MARDVTDIALTPEGDLMISKADLKTVTGDDFRIQSARNRIKSITKDWFYDNVGADLEELLGKPNTQAIADKGKGKIITALTIDGLFAIDEVYVKAFPTDKTNILFVVMLKSVDGTSMSVNVTMDLVKGITVT